MSLTSINNHGGMRGKEEDTCILMDSKRGHDLIDLDAGRTSILHLPGAQERIQYLLAKFSRPA
jgi:hypothetical protein